MIVSDVEGLTDRLLGIDYGKDSLDGVIDVAETAGLGTGAVNGDWLVFESRLDKAGNDHAVVANLAGADGVEKAHDANGEAFF